MSPPREGRRSPREGGMHEIDDPNMEESSPSSPTFMAALEDRDEDFELASLGMDDPPSYRSSARTAATRPKFAVQPREDEGHEALPPYSTSISLESVFLRKTELEGAVYRAYDRNWWKQYVTLRGTLLTFHRCKKEIFHRGGDSKTATADFPAGTKKGAFLRSYNLQHADVGIAADYTKKKYVIRIRAETDQFLLSCLHIETFVTWLQFLFTAIDLALPLDERLLPRDQTVPRHRRRTDHRRRRDLTREERHALMVQEQMGIITRLYPRLSPSPESDPETNTSRARRATSEAESLLALSRPHTAPSNSRQRANATTAAMPPPSRHGFQTSPRERATSHPVSHLTEDGKWRPHHHWSSRYDMLYARRCMAVLTSRAPRKTNVAIIKGKKWMVDWETGDLTRLEPPSYEEIDVLARESETGGHLRAGRYGNIVVV